MAFAHDNDFDRVRRMERQWDSIVILAGSGVPVVLVVCNIGRRIRQWEEAASARALGLTLRNRGRTVAPPTDATENCCHQLSAHWHLRKNQSARFSSTQSLGTASVRM